MTSDSLPEMQLPGPCLSQNPWVVEFSLFSSLRTPPRPSSNGEAQMGGTARGCVHLTKALGGGGGVRGFHAISQTKRLVHLEGGLLLLHDLYCCSP